MAGARDGRNDGNSQLRRRSRRAPLAEFDRLPPPLRQWLSTAVLPWSAVSARRSWQRALRESGGDTGLALERMRRIEARTLARDTALVWGRAHPGAGMQAPL